MRDREETLLMTVVGQKEDFQEALSGKIEASHQRQQDWTAEQGRRARERRLVLQMAAESRMEGRLQEEYEDERRKHLAARAFKNRPARAKKDLRQFQTVKDKTKLLQQIDQDVFGIVF